MPGLNPHTLHFDYVLFPPLYLPPQSLHGVGKVGTSSMFLLRGKERMGTHSCLACRYHHPKYGVLPSCLVPPCSLCHHAVPSCLVPPLQPVFICTPYSGNQHFKLHLCSTRTCPMPLPIPPQYPKATIPIPTVYSSCLFSPSLHSVPGIFIYLYCKLLVVETSCPL